MERQSTTTESTIDWQPGTLHRIPYALYQDPAIYRREQQRVFQGPHWNYLCLECEVAQPGDFRTTRVGEMPVVVTRDADGELYAFENRCSHRGALICLERQGRSEEFQCVYHAWRYDRQGNLKGIAFENGINGRGGMNAGLCKESIGPRKLRVATYCGLVFASLSEEVEPIEDYLGDEICARIERVLDRPIEVIGRYTQDLPNNWKLYFENVKDSYHASLLHMFFTTFRINRLSQRGGIIVDASGGHHVSYSMIDRSQTSNAEYSTQGIRADDDSFRLEDPTLLAGFDEYPDGITLQILSVFPGFVLQQIQNCLAVRQVLPAGIERTELNWTLFGYRDDTPEQREMRLKQSNLIGPAGFISLEDGAVGGFVQRGIRQASQLEAVVEMGGTDAHSDDTRVTEASVRGFWKAYRSAMAI